jgi:hypothetical protein
MGGTWLYPEVVDALCKKAIEKAQRRRQERFEWMTRQDHEEGIGGLINRITKTPYDPVYYQWVFEESASDRGMSDIILRGHVWGGYWSVVEKANRLRCIACMKMSANAKAGKMESLQNYIPRDTNDWFKEQPGIGVWVSDEDLRGLDLTYNPQVECPNDPKSS